MTRRARTALLIALPLAFVACSSDSRKELGDAAESAISEVGNAVDEATQDAAETIARTLATEQGEEQFQNAGHPIEGKLTCTAETSDDLDAIDIDCTGTTEEGGAVLLTGRTSELPGASVVTLDGQFVGTVDGAEVFTTTRLGG